MKTIWIKQFENYIVDAITFDPNRDDYSPIEVQEMPFDVMCGCYQLIDGVLLRDEIKHTEQQHENSSRTKIEKISAELDKMLNSGEVSQSAFDNLKPLL